MSWLSGERIVVTGGAGFIGRALARAFRDGGAEVTVADLHAHPDLPSVPGDLTEPGAVERAVRPGTTGVVHTAARTSVLKSLQEPDLVYRTNVAMTAALLERCRALEVPRLIFTSTNAVVGAVDGELIDERSPLRPRTPYGASKAAAEMLLAGYANGYGLAATSLRLTNVYGPGMTAKDSLVPRLMRAAASGSPIEIYGDGEQVRDFVHLDDVVVAVRLAWVQRVVGPILVGAGHSVSVNTMVDLCEQASGRAITRTGSPSRPGEMRQVVVDIGRARALGYRPSVDLAEGLAGVWADFRPHES
ncbi:MAG TPA: NAD-dependent epimerase/dehydratase family protein [Mycobacteriales bacterium]|nr:NAD-dependent epimerase/dehydratase family protein [Mycobacteriales bacterium]